MSPSIEEGQEPVTNTEGEKRIEQFKGLLAQIEDKANQIVGESDGNVDAEAVKFGKSNFAGAVTEIGRIARQVCIMLDHASYSAGIGPFKANAGPKKIALGRMSMIGSDEEFNRLLQMQDTEELTKFLQTFFDSAKSITADFEATDRADNGGISEAIRRGE